MASLIGIPISAVASSAAPGVDQAVRTGLRKYSERPMQVTPLFQNLEIFRSILLHNPTQLELVWYCLP
jgi:hypothetical protein